MGIAVTCSNCHARLNVRDDMAGVKGRCPKCGSRLHIPDVAARSEPVAKATVPRSTPSNDGDSPVVAPKRRAPSPAERHALSPSAARAAVDAAFQGRLDAVRVSLGYRLAVCLVALYAVALTGLYYLLVVAAFVGLAGFAVLGHAMIDGPNAIAATATHWALVVAGLIIALGLLKTVIAPEHKRGAPPRTVVRREDERLLADFIERIAQEVGSPTPERVELECGVYVEALPSRGLTKPVGQDFTLVVGLSLMEGLSLQQFGGAVAHELGLFAAKSGRRRAYLIRRVSEWLQRIVTERDAWDWALLSTQSRLGPAGGWLIAIVRSAIWLARWIPWVFMVAFHAFAGPLMRQMAANADQYQARLAGTQAFESTCQRRVLLQYAFRGARADLEMFARAKQLPDNLPRFVVATEAQTPAEVHQTMLELIDRFETGPLDPRPRDKDRIASLRAAPCRGILHSDLPATVLLTDAQAIERDVTVQYYEWLLQKAFDRGAILPVDALIDCHALEEQAAEARKRYFLGAFGLLRPLRLPSSQLSPPAASQLVQTQLEHQRESMSSLAAEYSADYALYSEADRRLVEASQAIALFKAGLAPREEHFSTSFASQNQARELRASSRETLESLSQKMEAFEAAAGRRLHAALTLLRTPQMTGLIPTVSDDPAECERLLTVVSAIAGNLDDVYRLRTDHAKLTALIEHARGTSPGPSVMQEIQRRTQKVANELTALHQWLAHIDYPFHDESRTSVAAHLLPSVPPPTHLQAVMGKTSEFLDGVVSLYGRSIDRLCSLGEEVEASLAPVSEETPAAN